MGANEEAMTRSSQNASQHYTYEPCRNLSTGGKRGRHRRSRFEPPSEVCIGQTEKVKDIQPTSGKSTPAARTSGMSSGDQTVIPPFEARTFMPWLTYMPKSVYPTTEAKLHDEIVAFQRWAEPTPQELEARRITVECIETLVRRRIADANTQVFGSSAMSLALPSSDIDIVVTTQEIWTEMDMKLAMSQLAVLIKAAGLARHVVQIPNAKVPILKFTTLPEYGSFRVDISINNTNGQQVVSIVKDYIDKMPALKPLVFAVKAIVARYGLNNSSSGGLVNYAIICMWIFFIKANPSKRPYSFYENPTLNESLGVILSDFLWYFSKEFPYAASHMSAKEGALYPNRDPGYKDTLARMSVRCLVDPDLNITKSVKKKTLSKLVETFQKAFTAILQSSVRDESILGHFVTVEEEVVASRAHLHKLMERGEFHALLNKVRTSHSSQLSGPGFGVPLGQSTPKSGKESAADVTPLLNRLKSSQRLLRTVRELLEY